MYAHLLKNIKSILMTSLSEIDLGTYQGAVKKTRTGRDRSFERTLSVNSCSVSIIFPPDLAIPSWVLLAFSVLRSSVVSVLDIRIVLDDGTKALLVAKHVERMMQMMETIGILRIAEYFFDRERSSTLRGR